MLGLGMPEVVVLLVIGVALIFFIFWGWALIDILKNEFSGSNKIIWLLLVIFVPISFILYFIIGTKQKNIQ